MFITEKGYQQLGDEVFDDIRKMPFTLKEAAEYLEVAEITVRRWEKAGKLMAQKVGRNLVFDPDDLKQFKKHITTDVPSIIE